MADCEEPEEIKIKGTSLSMDDQKKSSSSADSESKACSKEADGCVGDSTNFARYVSYQSNGTTAVIDFTQAVSEECNKNGFDPPTNRSLERLTVLESTFQQSKTTERDICEKTETQHCSRSFRIRNLNPQEDNENESNDLLTKNEKSASEMLLNEDPFERKLLLCFPCHQKFGNSMLFTEHGRTSHSINFTNHDQKLLDQNVSAVIQVVKGNDAILCFLEAIEDNAKRENSDSTQRPLESEMKMDDSKEKVSTDVNIEPESRTDSPSESNSSLVQSDRAENLPRQDQSDLLTGEASKNSSPSASVESNILPHSLADKGIHKTMMSVSENFMRKSPSLQRTSTKGSVSAKTKDSLHGGVTNMDPLFHMSLFQSRNSCKTLKCPRCNWHYKYRQTLDAHMKEKHADETSDCIYCNANQPHPRLSRGESYACGYKPFKCEVCNYSTTTKGNLSIHMQSDKHLYNVKTMQHQRQQQQQQQQDKINGNSQTGVNTNDKTGGRLQQDQLQNLIQQQTAKTSSPDSILSRKAASDISSSATVGSSGNRRQPWRCDVCNYETDIPRNLKIHMQSEKHSNNVALAGSSRQLQESQAGIKMEQLLDDEAVNALNNSSNKEASSDKNPSFSNIDPNNSTMAALYYYLAALQNPMQASATDTQANSEEREKQQKQLMAQQQQLFLAQQYQQMLAQISGSTDAGPSTSLLQQQLLMQQQLQLVRHLFSQGDPSTNLTSKPSDVDMSLQDMNNPSSTSDKYLFTCGICCNFSCNDLESLCTHVRTPRYSRSSLEESEWVTKSATDGYLCRICNYTTQLKTNFSLHCKTEKHTSKLQLINHIREGGEANEWKISYAIAGNNMNKVACNGCRHSSTSIDKLRIHCSTDRHQGTLTMCHYFDTILKEAELNKGLGIPEEATSHRLSCRPCSYKSKFVVGMIQHMQCQSHQAKTHEAEQNGICTSKDIITVEPDIDETDSEQRRSSTDGSIDKDNIKEEIPNEEIVENKIYKCKLCIYETEDQAKLQEHNATQHFSQSAIKCPMCPEYLSDTTLFQAHLIEVHKLTEQRKPPTIGQPTRAHDRGNDVIEGTLQAIEIPCDQKMEEDRAESREDASLADNEDIQESNSNLHSCQMTNGADTEKEVTSLKCDTHFADEYQLRQHKQENRSNEEEKSSDSDKDHISMFVDKASDDHGDIDPSIFSSPRLLLRAVCTNPSIAAKALRDARFPEVWEHLEPPHTCSTCEETFVRKSDLLNHLATSMAHKTIDTRQNIKGQNIESTNDANTENQDSRSRADTHPLSRDETKEDVGLRCNGDAEQRPSESNENQGKNGPTSSNFDFSLLSDYKWKRGRLLYPGISKSAHKKVLEEVGFDQVSHFVENKSNENREKAKQWKKDSANTPDDCENSSDRNDREEGQNTTPELSCQLCGKEFSNSWILKVHEKSVHNMEMSPEMLSEFIQGYTSWYWDCLKKDAESAQSCRKQSNSPSLPTNEQSLPPPSAKSNFETNPSSVNVDLNTPSNTEGRSDEQEFKQAAFQALMKNYPGMVPQSLGGFPPQVSNQRQTPADDQVRMQQQMLIQCLMNAQVQAAMQQQAPAGGQSQQNTQPNSSSMMNMLVDHLYGAAVQGVTPGFIDPMAIMTLLQQQQSRLPGNNAINPYQWLAMRYLQQQQMQQLLMYPSTINGGNSFGTNLSENNVQQQMLSAFAASLFGANPASGVSQDSASATSLMNNPLASALHAYQLQAAAAAAMLTDARGGKEPEVDNSKMLRLHQQNNPAASGSQHQQLQAEMPAKRPRTRITDDQLKVLRSNFDINTSPGEDQIAEMAQKTNLPPKVIKHWFRNTLFKERQRSKDSPYNFNIPPITSLDDVNSDNNRTQTNSPQEDSASSPSQREGTDMSIHQNSANDDAVIKGESVTQSETQATNNEGPARNATQNEAIKLLKSLGCDPAKISEASLQQQIYPFAYMAKFSRSPENENPSLQLAADLSRKTGSDRDFPHNDPTNYLFGRSQAVNDYSFAASTPHSNMSTITRRTPRTRFSDYQLKVLQEFFDKNAYPKDEDLDRLSKVLELSTRVIVVWFQNARQKARKSYELQHGSISGQHSNNASFNNYSRKRHSPPLSPPDVTKHSLSPGRTLDLHAASKNFNHVPRDRISHTSISEEPSSPYKCSQCEFSFPTFDTLRDHERLHTSTNLSSVASQYKANDISVSKASNLQRRGSMEVNENKSENGRERTEHSPDRDGKVPHHQYDKEKHRSLNDIMSRFGLSNMMSSGDSKTNFDMKHASAVLGSVQPPQFLQRGDYIPKQSLSPSSAHNISPGSLTSPIGNRGIPNIKRKGMNESSKDPKRLRTTITPEQLEYLYQQYLVDSSPSRKVIEHISDIVGLKKRVVQVWFQNTRARERKGQFRSVGRITAVLGMPQVCPHCRVTFRTKADLDAHVRYRHMQSPSSVALSISQSQQMPPSTEAAYSTLGSSSRIESLPSRSKDKEIDYKELFSSINKQVKEKYLGQGIGMSKQQGNPDHGGSFGISNRDDEEPSAKRRKSSSGDSDLLKSHSSSTGASQTLSARTAEIYKAVTEQIFRNKASSFAGSAGQSNDESNGRGIPLTASEDIRSSTTAASVPGTSLPMETRAESPLAASSPESMGSSTGPAFMVPLKRYRTQMTSLQVDALKHCFNEYKTPTLLECEIVGDQIGLPKRVIQVWFQNARAKDKKARQGEMQTEQPESPVKSKSSCNLCPEVRFGSHQDYRNHVFSKTHIQNFITSVGGDARGEAMTQSMGYDSDEYGQKDSSVSNRTSQSTPSPPNIETKYRVSAIATSNGLNMSFPDNQSQLTKPWSPSALAKKYQQLSEIQELAANAVSSQSNDSNSQDSDKQEVALKAFRQVWLQQALLANGFRGDPTSRPFEDISSSQTTQAD